MEDRLITTDRLVTADMLHNLPAPVQRYMAYTGVVGKPWTHTARVRQSGRFRLGRGQPWMAMAAEQSYTTDPPGFVWKARFKMWGLPLMSARDAYRDGHGHMFGKLAGLFTIFDARGEKLDQGTMVRFLSEMPWFPIALLGKNITWQAVDDHSADVTFSDAGRSVTGRMYFDDEGRQTNFEAMRYREINGDYALDRWTAPVTG
jgi:hypothetical protein